MLKIYQENTLIKIALTLIFLSPLIYSTSYYNGFNSFKTIIFSLGVFIFCISCSFKAEYWKMQELFFKSSAFIIALFFLAGTAHSLLLSPGLIKDTFFQADILLIVYFLVLHKLLKSSTLQNFLIYLSILLLLLCVTIGVLQAVHIIPSSSNFFKITGTFLNPGPYACLISLLLVIPISILLLRKNIISDRIFIFFKDNYEPFLVVLVLFSSMILVLSEVRAALLAIIIISIAILFNKRYAENQKLFRRYIIFFLLGSVALVISMAFFIKKDSSNGRLLIWKTAISNKPENILIGNGYEYFEYHYNVIQSVYFSGKENPNDYDAKLAGNVSYAYNEFIEVYTNYGLIGLVAIIILIFYVVISYYKNYHAKELVFHISFYVLLAIFIQSLISYPFSMLANKILFMTWLAVFCNYVSKPTINKSAGPKYFPPLLRMILIAVCVFAFWGISNSILGYRKWKDANEAYMSRDYQKALSILNQQRGKFSSSGPFLVYQGKVLFLEGEFATAIEVLEKAKLYSSDPILFYTLGQCYSELGKNMRSEENFDTAINIAPNRLYPRYLLLKHYIKLNNIDQAVLQAKIIMGINEKVSSKATSEIKKFAWSFLSRK